VAGCLEAEPSGKRGQRKTHPVSGGVALVGLSAMPGVFAGAAAATVMPNKKQLVVLFQRGAADGLNIVVPFSEANYYGCGRRLRFPQPRRGGGMRRLTWMDFRACIRADGRRRERAGGVWRVAGIGGLQLNEGRDLALTTDSRFVLGEILSKHKWRFGFECGFSWLRNIHENLRD